MIAAALAASASFATSLAAQGNPAQDIAPRTSLVPVYMPGTPRVGTDGANVIYTNGPYVSHVAGGFGGADASALDAVLGHTTFGSSCNASTTTTATATAFRLADDFTVPAGEMWYVESVKFHAYRTVTAGSPAVAFNNGVCRIWDAPPNGPANIVFGDVTTNRLASSTWDNCYRVTTTTLLNNQRFVMENVLTVGKLFGPGTYWVEMAVNTTVAGTAFAPPITNGLQVTGNALQVTVPANTWGPMLNGVHAAGVPFQLCGEIARCWETTLGTNLALGDDQLSPAQALPFSFRMPGALVGGATTTQVRVCSNGFVWLDGTSISADFSPTTAEFTALAPRIACPWDDFYPPGGGAVYSNITATRGIFTWHRIDTFPTTPTTRSMLQLQMFPNGAFTINCLYHEPVTPRTPVFGVSAGLAAPSVAIDYSAGHVGVPGTATIYEGFVSGTSDLSGKMFTFTPRDDGVSATYDVSVTTACGPLATATLIGPGCFGMSTVVTDRAISGSNLVLTSTLPAGSVFGTTFVGLTPAPNSLLLPLTGGLCFLHHGNELGSFPLGIAGSVGTTTISMPGGTAFLGLPICTQAGVIAPGVNALGAAMSNAWLTILGIDG